MVSILSKKLDGDTRNSVDFLSQEEKEVGKEAYV